MDELLVVISAELILLVAIVVITIHSRRADVLKRLGPGETDYAGSDRSRTGRARGHPQRETLRLQSPLARERTTTNPSTKRGKMAPARAEAEDPANHSRERQAHSVAQVTGQADSPPIASNQLHRVTTSLPHGVRIYAIGDIHGRSDLLSPLLRCIEADRRQRPVERAITVFVGDYIDRGPHSRDVIDLLLRWRENNDAVFLRGNHEAFLLQFLSDSKTLDDWRQCGGLETLLSYGLRPSISPDRDEQARLADQLANSLPKEHFGFLGSLQPYYICGDFLFVHAGIRPGIPIDEQAEEDLLWIREGFLACEEPFERFVVHGHTPVATIDLRSNRINIDTGAFATGRLACIVIEGSGIRQLSASAPADDLIAP